MQVRRKQGGRPLLAMSIRSLIMGCLVVLLIVYIVSFATVISSSNTTPKEDKRMLVDFAAREKEILGGLAAREKEILGDLVKRGGKNLRPAPAIEISKEQVEATAQAPPVAVHEHKESAGTTVGFAVTITGCGSDPITEGAAVLKHSIHLASVHGNGRYDYQMYAIYHPDGEKCAKTLEALGYKLVKRETPVAVKDIQGEFLRSRIEKNGCCGEKELVKLEAYTLTQHPIIVHLDLDTLLLKPLDSLFDWMMAGDKAKDFDASGIELQWPKEEVPNKINAFFTRDYNMWHGQKVKPVQGGFLVLRPDMDVYKEFVEIIRKGHFTKGGGWGDKTGVFYGSMTFQGIIPYYYDILHPGQHVEANHCVYNQMCDNPRSERTVNDVVHGKCMTGAEDCEDCRSRPLEDVYTSHFTLCQKPWLCFPEDSDMIQQRLCRKLHHEWHRIRSDLEQSWGRPAVGKGSYQKDHFYGHCKSHGQKGYIYIQEPFGIP